MNKRKPKLRRRINLSLYYLYTFLKLFSLLFIDPPIMWGDAILSFAPMMSSGRKTSNGSLKPYFFASNGIVPGTSEVMKASVEVNAEEETATRRFELCLEDPGLHVKACVTLHHFELLLVPYGLIPMIGLFSDGLQTPLYQTLDLIVCLILFGRTLMTLHVNGWKMLKDMAEGPMAAMTILSLIWSIVSLSFDKQDLGPLHFAMLLLFVLRAVLGYAIILYFIACSAMFCFDVIFENVSKKYAATSRSSSMERKCNHMV